jgi:hypothetical protein
MRRSGVRARTFAAAAPADRQRRVGSRAAAVVAAVIACVTSLTACGSNGDRINPELAKLRESRQPYYYVGRSFDGLRLVHLEPYGGSVANFIYGTCKAGDDHGCAPPLALQHRLCRGRVTVVIFTGANPKPGRAARAGQALRPLSRGAREVTPDVAFDRSPPC